MIKNVLVTILVLVTSMSIVSCNSNEQAKDTLRYSTISMPKPKISSIESQIIESTIVDFPKAESMDTAVDGSGHLYILALNGKDALVSKSTDGGITFSDGVKANLNISAGSGPIDRPTIALGSQGVVGVAWKEPLGQYGRIWYSSSENGGGHFGPAVRVDERIATPSTHRLVRLAMLGDNNPIVTWTEDIHLRVTRSYDGGKTFATSRSMDRAFTSCTNPDILSVGGENVLVAYRNLEEMDGIDNPVRDIVVMSSNDARRFLEHARAPDKHWPVETCPESGASLAYDHGNIFVTWMDARFSPTALKQTDVWFASSFNINDGFSENIRVNTTDARHNHPSMTISPDKQINIVWEARESDMAVIYYSFSDDNGKSFSTPKIVVSSNDGSERGTPGYPSITADTSGNIHVAWLDNLGGHIATWQNSK